MRKFKARIWDQKEKCFHRPEQEGHTAAISLDGTVCFGYVGGNMVSVEVDEEGNTDYEIQMFSGLMDSDGKPIYEGDILEWSVPSNQPAMESRGVVAFSEAACYIWRDKRHFLLCLLRAKLLAISLKMLAFWKKS